MKSLGFGHGVVVAPALWWWPSAGRDWDCVGTGVPAAAGTQGKADKGLSSPWMPPGSGRGKELFQGGVEGAAPALPWLYLGQAALGSALKCEAASLSIAGGKK